MIHKMKLQSNPFDNIASGKKTIESRLYDEKRSQINLGDKIEFTDKNNPNKTVITDVKALYKYKTFEEMFSDFNPALFGGDSEEGLLNEINAFYPIEEQKKFGVVGIKIELCK